VNKYFSVLFIFSSQSLYKCGIKGKFETFPTRKDLKSLNTFIRSLIKVLNIFPLIAPQKGPVPLFKQICISISQAGTLCEQT